MCLINCKPRLTNWHTGLYCGKESRMFKPMGELSVGETSHIKKEPLDEIVKRIKKFLICPFLSTVLPVSVLSAYFLETFTENYPVIDFYALVLVFKAINKKYPRK